MDANRPSQGRLNAFVGLIGLIAGLLLGGLALYSVAGGPRLPSDIPAWGQVLLTLRGSAVPYEAIGVGVTTAAWAVWGWMVASIVLRLVVVGADAASRGATWVAPLRAFSDLVTVPVIRRLVDGA